MSFGDVAERPRVFLSYAHEDAPHARTLARLLEEQGAVAWSSTASLPVGSPVTRAIGDALRSSDAVLVLGSPASRRSTAVGRELAAAIAERLTGEPKVVVPVLLGEDDEIPPLLRDVQALDLRSPQDEANAVREFVSQLRSRDTRVRTTEDAEIALESAYRQLIQAELAHRHSVQAQMLEYNARLQRTGQALAVVLYLVAAVAGLVLAIDGAPSASVAIFVTVLASLAVATVAARQGTERHEP